MLNNFTPSVERILRNILSGCFNMAMATSTFQQSFLNKVKKVFNDLKLSRYPSPSIIEEIS